MGRHELVPGSRTTDERELRAATAPFAVLAVWLVGLAAIVWAPFPGGLWHDDGVYLMVGKALSSGEGFSYLGVPGQPPAAKFPPIYPGFMASLWLVFRQVAPVVAAAQILNLLFAVGAGVLFARFLHRGVGLERWTAVGVAALGWLVVELWQFSMIPLSEALFLFELSLFLALATRAEAGLEPGDRSGMWGLVGLAALAGALVLTRSAGLAIVAGAVIALLSLRRRREAGAVMVGTALLIPWMLWSRAANATIPGPLRDILGSYTSWWIGRVRSDVPAFLAGLPASVGGNADRILLMLFPGLPLGVSWALAIVAFPLMAWGIWILSRKNRTAAFALVGYLALLAVWPFQNHRLLVPVMPLIVTVAALPVLEAAQGWRMGTTSPDPKNKRPSQRPAAWRTALIGVGIAWATFYTGSSLLRLTTGQAQIAHEQRRDALAAVVETLAFPSPGDRVVGAPELWAAIHLYTGLRVSPSAPFRPGSGAGVSGSPTEQWAVWNAGEIDLLFAERGGLIHGDAIEALEARCPGVMGLLAQLDGAFLLDIGRNDPCVRAELERAGGT